MEFSVIFFQTSPHTRALSKRIRWFKLLFIYLFFSLIKTKQKPCKCCVRFQKVTDHHSHHTYTKHIPISLSLPFSLKSPNPNSFFSQRQHHQQQQQQQNTTQLIVSCLQIPIFSFYCYIIYTLVWKTVSWFSRKKKCIPKWIQPNPITYRVFFFASTSTAKRVIWHFWLQLFLSLSLHICLLISVVVVFFLIESRK